MTDSTTKHMNKPPHPSRMDAINDWIIHHDDKLLFTILYIGLAVVLSIWIGLFWLVAVVAVHFAFEIVRQRSAHSTWAEVVAAALWELKLDLALVLFALVVSLYMEVVLGVAGLQGAARLGSATQAGIRGGARFVAWQRIIRGALLTIDDAAQIIRVVLGKKAAGKKKSEESQAIALTSADPLNSGWAGPWSKGDWFTIGMAVAFVAVLLAAPFLTDHTYSSAFTALTAELHPFPGD